MHARSMLVLSGMLLCPQTALAACDLPTIGPTDVLTGSKDGKAVHVVTGVVGICDPVTRSFDVALPDLQGIRAVHAQLSVAGFSRHYGVHQIGFVLQSVAAAPNGKGVTVQYGAAIDGLDRYQLAYTLYLTMDP